jgi:hypothetical protein
MRFENGTNEWQPDGHFVPYRVSHWECEESVVFGVMNQCGLDAKLGLVGKVTRSDAGWQRLSLAKSDADFSCRPLNNK